MFQRGTNLIAGVAVSFTRRICRGCRTARAREIYKSQTTPIKCASCGVDRTVGGSRKRGPHCLSCARRAIPMTESRKEWFHRKGITLNRLHPRPRGEKAYAWRGGLTPAMALVRNCERYNAWRIAIFKRDPACIACGSKRNLEADHYPVPFVTLFRAAKSLGVHIDDFDPMWDVGNGRTLCATCHDKYGHRVYAGVVRPAKTQPRQVQYLPLSIIPNRYGGVNAQCV